MVTITLNNITNLNTSLQIGDLVYTTNVNFVDNNNTLDQQSSNTVEPINIVGILRRITNNQGIIVLDVDETPFFNSTIPDENSFIMFSKYDQTNGDVVGYYAKAKFSNNSKQRAELFSVGSEVTINSK